MNLVDRIGLGSQVESVRVATQCGWMVWAGWLDWAEGGSASFGVRTIPKTPADLGAEMASVRASN